MRKKVASTVPRKDRQKQSAVMLRGNQKVCTVRRGQKGALAGMVIGKMFWVGFKLNELGRGFCPALRRMNQATSLRNSKVCARATSQLALSKAEMQLQPGEEEEEASRGQVRQRDKHSILWVTAGHSAPATRGLLPEGHLR